MSDLLDDIGPVKEKAQGVPIGEDESQNPEAERIPSGHEGQTLEESGSSLKQADEVLSSKLKQKIYVYEYQSPNPDIRQRFKEAVASAPPPDVQALHVSAADTEDQASENKGSYEPVDKANRLNPKLTRRAYVYEYNPPRPEIRDKFVKQLFDGPPGSDSDSDHGGDYANSTPLLPEESTVEVAVMDATMKKKLMHPGGWVAPQYMAGKLQPGTGLWTCCVSREQFSIYCTSLKKREDTMQENAIKSKKAKKAVKYADRVQIERRGPWERQEIIAVEQDQENAEDMLMNKANTEESTLNGPMLISWTHKNMSDHRTALSGLGFLLRTLQTGEGCVLFHRHGGCDTVLKAFNFHPKNPEILLTCAKLWCQLLDCNFTRDFLIDDTVVMQAVFSIANRHMRSGPHVEVAMRCLMQCSRSEICRVYMYESNLMGYYTLFCKSFSKKPEIIRPVLRSFNWFATTDKRLVVLFQLGCINTTIKCMERHISNPAVLAPALLLLTRVAAIHLPAAEFIVRKKAIPTVVNALRALYSNELLQVEGLKMLRALSRSEEGWDQISKMKGGWQAICQGTAVGDALIHELQGSFHNPGWCIGETPHLPLLERRKLAVAALSAAANQASRIKPKGAWTTHSLRQFMGLTMKVTRLSVNNEEHDVHFEVVSTLDLLPNPREEKEEWFARINQYETDNEIKISDMVEALISMRQKKKMEDRVALRESLLEDEEQEYIKPIYVAGKLFNQKDMEESDKNLADHLAGVV